MDDGGHRDNGWHKASQGKQWMIQQQPQQHQPSMKQVMSIIAERDAAIQERNLAISEKKAAIAERDMAFLQRDTAIAERNNAIIERDSALAALHYRDNSMPTTSRQHQHHMFHTENAYEAREMEPNETSPKRGKRAKEPKASSTTTKAKRGPKTQRKVKKENEDDLTTKMMFVKTNLDYGEEEETSRHLRQEMVGLNQVVYDQTTMPPPVCSCTGVPRQCYKWGNGGWQSSCCTNTLSMHPLPAQPNKKHARVGGRKMSGSAFNKLLSRLAAEGHHDLSNPVDLKDHWAKHGTNRYITIR
ncbi:unnamed protein product [Eruca vesicaria subsp. sativa]|uniref:GAGA-binding transcriptional activator n=1 Tax=Eruca vesicaria subsp. sativa TaxID=29727 RepID=A0ABC8IWG7_ERUVS|nr:unnamed protein product [Eruca vesicaria subsp. sativa]